MQAISFCIANDLRHMILDLRNQILRYGKALNKNDPSVDKQLIEIVHCLVIYLCVNHFS
jgi:hypothetical protein